MYTGQIDSLVGKMIGMYQLERLLGQGQLSALYAARQRPDDRVSLVTVFRPPEQMPAQERALLSSRLARESAAITRLQHPHILQTCEYGETTNFFYLITPYAAGTSLAQLLKQQARLAPEQARAVLAQLASALDYAHSNGVIHGMLSLTSVQVRDNFDVQIAGFGLHSLLAMHGNRPGVQPPAHLLSATGAFLGHPEYVAPEQVQGMSFDARADIYALGIMLFELLSGEPPFRITTALETAVMRLQQPVPPLRIANAAVAESLNLVLAMALERAPANRYRSSGEFARAFERTLNIVQAAEHGSAPTAQHGIPDRQATLPTTLNWADGAPGDSLPGVDPFAWWADTAAPATQPEPGTFLRSAQNLPARLAQARGRRQPVQQGRRQLVKVMVTGTVVAGVFAAGGISFAHFVQSLKLSQQAQQAQQAQQFASGPTTAQTTATQSGTPAPGATSSPQPTAASKSTATATPKPTPAQGTPQPTPKPTQPPAPTPTSTPSHTGTVIGSTSQPVNSAVSFTNPADGHGSLLIHLPDGKFVACERACTHAGVPVDYSSGQQQLVCPAHGAIFDPANGFSHVSGPGNGPLAGVSIRVNADGTITTG